ncbi:MAG TPA: diaminopimelate epimerase, partial [Solirubrobacterales bacterium]|nr:diaminopimelate epimerase [Solirubrobacterales bacterium]
RVGAVKFEKWQALGNDYLILEEANLPWDLTQGRVEWLCDQHFGIGADGVLLLSPADDPEFVADLRIFNPDGSEAELSGNGAREAILYLRRHGWTDADEFAISTIAGPIRPTITGELTCSVDMGKASTTSKDFPSGGPDGRGTVRSAGREWEFQHVSIGNPQCAIVVDQGELADLDLELVGPEIEGSTLFPNRTNVSFLAVDGSHVRARIFERGVGETLSSGTGASGAAVTAFLRGAPSPLTVELDGGELTVAVGEDLAVRLDGWAEPVFSGEATPELLAALAEQG